MSANDAIKHRSQSTSTEFGVVVGRITDELLQNPACDLKSLVGEYPQYARQVQDMLPVMQAMADLGSSPSQSGSSDASEFVANSHQPRELGDFRILREIGRGGMGVVYEAEQLSLSRHVALKVLPFASLLDRRHLERFKNEARAAASLKHPNIVGVYSVGYERSVHFYAMELVEGQSLAEVIADLRGDETDTVPTDAETRPVAALSTERETDSGAFFRRVAGLGIQAAEALDHAHGVGIVHRDIKPSNLMVDMAGKLLITDFGLAQIQGEGNLTMTGDLVGTLRYMSPEQAAGDRAVLDHRADIYSLGITLYELLTLRPAFEGSEKAKLLHDILEHEPPAPRSINGAIPRDLETIVLKAISKEPADRYASATELAADLRRFVDGTPVVARRSSPIEKALRWSRRHRGIVASVVVTLFVTLSIGSVLLWQSSQRTATALATADGNLRAARVVMDSILEKVKQVEEVSGSIQLHRELLTDILRFYTTLPDNERNDPEILRETAQVYGRVADIHGALDDRRQSFAYQEKRASLLTDLVKDHPNDTESRLKLASSLQRMAKWMLLTPGIEYRKSPKELVDEAIALLEDLVDQFSGELAYRMDLSEAKILIPSTSNSLVQDYREQIIHAYGERRALVAASPDNWLFINSLRGVLPLYAGIMKGDGRFTEARAAEREALQITRRQYDKNPESTGWRRALAARCFGEGTTLFDQGKYKQGLVLVEEAAQLMERNVVERPKSRDQRRYLLTILTHCAQRLILPGLLAESRSFHERAIRHTKDQVVAMKGSLRVQQQRWMHQTLLSYAELLVALGDSQQARHAYQESMDLARELADMDLHNEDDQAWLVWTWSICPYPDIDCDVDVVDRLQQTIARSNDPNTDSDEGIIFGWAHLRRREWKEAKRAFAGYSNASESAFSQVDALIGLGWAQWKLGDRDDALHSYEVAKEQFAHRTKLFGNHYSGDIYLAHKRLLDQLGRTLEIAAVNRKVASDEHPATGGEH